jgi:hypothetical protein
MRIEIETTVDLSKQATLKNTTDGEEELSLAQVRFKNAKLTLVQLDELCNRSPGWSEQALFRTDELPCTPMVLHFPKLTFEASGRIHGHREGDSISLVGATLNDVRVALIKSGASMSGQLMWKSAGDEAADLEPLLGHLCGMHLSIVDSQQQDLPL